MSWKENNMNIEESVKKMIIDRYTSLRQFAFEIDIPYTTLQSIFNRGLDKAGIQNVIKICQAIGIDTDALADGKIEERKINDSAVTISEKELLKKYRMLDKYGKIQVNSVIQNEFNRIHEQYHMQETNPDYQYLVDKDKLYITQYDYGVSAGIGNYLDEWDVPKTTVQIADSPIARKADYILKVDGDSMMPNFEDGDRVFVKAQETVEMNEIGIFVIDSTCYLKQFKGDRLHSLNQDYDDIALNEFQNIKCVGKVLGKV